MILVTLGTQDKSFVRLLKAIDREIKKGNIKEKVIVHINNVSKIIGLKRIKLSQGTIIHIQNELVLALKELEEEK